MLLLTAFEPFDGTGINSSEQALLEFRRLYPREIGGVEVASTILPVDFGRDVEALSRFRRSLPQPPRAILHLGQTFRAEVAVEQRAVNLRLPGSRSSGTSDELVPIREGAPPILLSTFPAEAIHEELRSAQVPCCLSQDAGTYLCNHILFHSLLQAAREGSPGSVGFLHLPRFAEQLVPESEPASLPLEVLAHAVEVAARVVAARLDGMHNS